MAPAHASEPAIVLRGVSKTFYPPEARGGSLKEIALGLFSRAGHLAPIPALRGIELQVQPGEAVGIVGANGSGKSTLLKIIAGITPPTEGEVIVRGRILGLIELGAGFQQELTGEENVHLQGAIYGLTRGETARRADAIFEFAELEDFRSTPLRFYSSGMIVRLGFAIAIHCDPDLLLIDEVLSVGDQRFQRRCLETVAELRERGKTIVFVTHQMEFAERICERIVWLQGGAIHREGPSLEVLHAYHRQTIQRQYGAPEGELTPERVLVILPGRFGTGAATIEDVRFVDGDGAPRRNFRPGEPMAIEVDYQCDPAIAAVDCSIVVDAEDGVNVAFWRAEPEGALQRPRDGRGRFRLRIPDPPFLPGHYTVTLALSPPGGVGGHFDQHLRLHHFTVLSQGAWASAAPIRLRPRAAWSPRGE